MEKTNFLCPMCRMRISTWSRNASNSNSLVNIERWSQIKKAFPIEIKNRMEGRTAKLIAEEIKRIKNTKSDVSSKEDEKSKLNLSAPGEIRKEYEEYLKRENY